MRIVDLSHPFRPGHWRWNPILRHSSTHAEDATFQSGSLQTPLHAFTHVDAPVYFLPDGRSIDQLPVDAWVGEATVVDLSSLQLGHGHGVLAEHLDKHARQVRQGDIVLLRTDWDRRCDVSTDRFWRDGPFTTRPAAEWLAACGVKAHPECHS